MSGDFSTSDEGLLRREQYPVRCFGLCLSLAQGQVFLRQEESSSLSLSPGVPCGCSGLSFCLILTLFSVHDLNGSLHPVQFQITLALAKLVHQERTETERANSPIARGHNGSCIRMSISFSWYGMMITCHQVLTAHHQCQIQRQCQSSMHLEHTAFCELL